MISANPPKLASWLLYHQVGGYRAESLVGDLTEEYAHGRGDGWYWGQVLFAVARSYRRALRLYGVHALLAVAVGWAAIVIGILLLEKIWALLPHVLSSLSAQWPAQRLSSLNVFLRPRLDAIGRRPRWGGGPTRRSLVSTPPAIHCRGVRPLHSGLHAAFALPAAAASVA